MLFHLNARVKCFWRVVVKHRHCGLKYDWAGVDSCVDEVDRASGNLRSVFKRLRPAVEAGEGGEQRRVNVEDALREGVQEAGFDYAHVAREDDGVHAVFAQYADDLVLRLAFKLGLERGVVNPEAFEVVACGACKNACSGDVGDDDCDFGVESSRLDRVLN